MVNRQYQKRKVWIVLIVLTLLVGIVSFHTKLCSQVFASCTTSQITQPAKQLAPRYFEYSSESLQTAQSTGKVILYFWAPWCSTCTSLDLDIQKDPNLIPEGTSVLRVNYDTELALRHQYNVITQHTFVLIDRHGQSVTQWVGGDPATLRTHLR